MQPNNNSRLTLSIEHYDELGRVKPPVWAYLIIMYLMRPILIFIGSVTMRGGNGSKMMEIFYPDKYQFYLALLPSSLGLFALLIIIYRNKIYSKSYGWAFNLLPLLIIASLIGDAALQMYILSKQQFVFSISPGLSLLGACCSACYLSISAHLKEFNRDWADPPRVR